MYTLGLKLVHILFAATWFGAVIAVAYTLTLAKQGNKEGVNIALKIITRIENIASIGIVITAMLIILNMPAFFQQGWVHVKLTLWLVATGLLHVSKAKLKKLGDAALEKGSFDFLRSALLLTLIIAITMAVFRPF